MLVVVLVLVLVVVVIPEGVDVYCKNLNEGIVKFLLLHMGEGSPKKRKS